MPASQSSPRAWIVQKYGGDSVELSLSKICKTIIPSYLKDYRVALICSSLSDHPSTPGTTSLLLQCIKFAQAGIGFQPQLNVLIDVIKRKHYRVLDTGLVRSDKIFPDILRLARARIDRECETLRRFLLAVQIVGELSSRAKDRVISLGDTLACILVSSFLEAEGIEAEAVILDDIVEATFGPEILHTAAQDAIMDATFYTMLGEEISRRVRACEDKVPVITGFFGIMPCSLTRCVGYDYSDTCATMCALSLRAHELQIWSENEATSGQDTGLLSGPRAINTCGITETAKAMKSLTNRVQHESLMLRFKIVSNPGEPEIALYPCLTSPNLIKDEPSNPTSGVLNCIKSIPNYEDSKVLEQDAILEAGGMEHKAGSVPATVVKVNSKGHI